MKNSKSGGTKIKVSILCLAYNHSKYISKTLDSFLKQNTNFDFEILVHDDFSTDETTDILKNYVSKHPKKIKVVFQSENQYSKNGGGILYKFLLPLAKGEYIAVCEGDDYWIDDKKLQKQVDFMDKHKDFSICFTKIKTLKNGKLLSNAHSDVYPKLLGERTVFTLEDILLDNFIATCSVIYRRKDIAIIPATASKLPFGDWTLNTLTAQNGKIKYLNEPMAVYRVHNGGVWSSLSLYEREKVVLSFYLFINEYFKGKFNNIIINKIHDIALYNMSPTTNKISSDPNSIITHQKYEKIISKMEKKNKKDLDYVYEKYYNLQNKITEIETSISWRLITTIRTKILDKFITNRTVIRRKIAKPVKSIKNKFKNLINRFHRLRPTIQINYLQKSYSIDKPLISIVVVCYNYGQYVTDAVNSVLNQTFQDFEIIIVESNSVDNSREVINKFNDRRIKKYFRKERHLAGDNRNYGIQKSNGKYICCLDADDMIKPTYLEKAVFLLETENYDLVSTSIQTFGVEEKIYRQIPNAALNNMMLANHIATVAVFKKDFYTKTGGYHDFGTGENYVFEDWDLWVRMSALGARFHNIYEPLMLYRLHGTNSLSGNLNNMSFEEQRQKILTNNSKYLTQFNFLNSKIRNKLIKYVVYNKLVNLLRKKSKEQILFALPFTALGGADNIFLNLVSLFNKNNISCCITTTVDFDNTLHDTTDQYEKTTNCVYHLPRFIYNASAQKSYIDYLIIKSDIRVIFIGGSKFYYDLLPYIKKTHPHIKVVDIQFNTDVHFTNCTKYIKYIDHIIAENQEVYDKYTIEKNISKNMISLISYGVETDKFKPSQTTSLPKQIPEKKFIISFLGRQSPEKNPEFMIKLAEKFKNSHKLFFILAGPGPLFEKLKNRIIKLGLKNIYMPGSINSLDYLSFTDLLILPSTIDGNPIVIKEAFSMGIPVIASNVGGVPYIVKNNETGFICDINSITQFSQAIDKMVSSPELLQQMKKNCREYAIKNLDLKVVNEKFLSVFKRYIKLPK